MIAPRAALRLTLVAALTAAIAALFVHDALLVRLMTATLHGNDFGKFYSSARVFLDNRDLYAPSPATELPVATLKGYQFLNMNPPTSICWSCRWPGSPSSLPWPPGRAWGSSAW